jgi:hypothetical protein
MQKVMLGRIDLIIKRRRNAVHLRIKKTAVFEQTAIYGQVLVQATIASNSSRRFCVL